LGSGDAGSLSADLEVAVGVDVDAGDTGYAFGVRGHANGQGDYNFGMYGSTITRSLRAPR
jgi:hypothetical protein